ncbi:MAG: YkgJ family cysteine cluster protein [Desulfobulbales bacterium]|nr:YkgJ family cysteine cluster protein [Desulfobulbales bacterium]
MAGIGSPQNVRGLGAGETFRFSCHPGVPCFTDCCRQLDLALTPYDVLRLRKGLGIAAAEFLDGYTVIEKGGEDLFPTVFLAMIDDGRAACPFVTEDGCSVYRDRPGACRTYPVGRGAYLDGTGRPAELFVLLSEPHCRGFEAGPRISVADWLDDQDLAVYNEFNDLLLPLLRHRRIKEGFRPDGRQQARYLEVLYNLDDFRLKSAALENVADPDLLKSAILLLDDELFS